MKSRNYLLLILSLSVLLSIYAAVLGLREMTVSNGLIGVWFIVFTLLVMFWAYTDAQNRGQHQSLDFSFYFLVAWPVALPVYLVKTRGVEGLIYFIGFATLYWLPVLFGLISYVYLTAG